MSLIFTANQSMSAPPAGTPTLPDIATKLAFDFNFDGLKQTITNGSQVPSISSSVGSLTLNEKIGSAFPTLTHAGPNGHAALRFAGSNTIATPNTVSPIVAGETATIAIVVRTSAVANSFRILSGNTSNEGYRFISPEAGGYRASGSNVAVSPAEAGVIAGPASAGQWHVVIATFQGAGASSLRIDGGSPIAGSLGRGLMKGLQMGSVTPAYVDGSAFVGDIARVIIYKRALTPVDAEGLAAELMTTYGIA